MSEQNNDRAELEENFAAAKILEAPQLDGAAVERALLNKETKRLMQESANFEKSKASTRLRLMKVAFGMAGGLFVLCLVEGFAIAALAPMKTVVPYLLEVNKVTGETHVRQPLDKPVQSQGEAVDKFFISEYIRAREGYDWGLANRNYRTVKAFSEDGSSIFKEYDLFIQSPLSPLEILQDKARVEIKISSTTLDEKSNSATVRFSKTVMNSLGKQSDTIPVTYWIATLRYEYPNPKLDEESRSYNPLGMIIPSYQLVQERNRG